MRHLGLYRAIRLIVRHGSIRKASEYLSISPSALNRAIQGFEDELGMPLFDRLSAGVRLSTAGELVFSALDAHLTRFDSLTESLAAMRDGVAGNLSLSLSSDLMGGVVTQALAELQARAPTVTLSVRNADDCAPLTARAVDLSILSHVATDDRLAVVTSRRCPLVAIGPREGPGAPAIRRLSDLAECRVILPPEGTGTRISIDHLFRKHRLTPRATTVYPGFWPGFGGRVPENALPDVQILPGFAVPRLPEDRMQIDLPLGTIQVTLVRRAESPLMRSAELFIARLQALMDPFADPL